MEKAASFLIWLIATILGKTWRFEVVSPAAVDIFDAGAAPKIYCFWHSTLLVVSYLFRGTGKAAIVSQSKDGRIAAGVARRWGHGVVFGSSHRGGAAALRGSLRALREGRSLGITPDGPKGPREEAKPGAAQIALATKTPVVAIRAETKSAWRLKSWDRFMIPLPFAKIKVTLSEPIEPRADNNGDNVDNVDGGDNRGNGINTRGINNTNRGGADSRAVAALTQLIQEKLAT